MTPAVAHQVSTFQQNGYVHVTSALDLAEGSLPHRFLRRSLRLHELHGPDGEEQHVPGVTSTPPRTLMDLARTAPELDELIRALVDTTAGDRGVRPVRLSDAFIINYQTPAASRTRWHIDGDFFVHFLDSPEQTLLMFVLWTDCHPGEGATEACPEGIKPIISYLQSHPAGVRSREIPVNSLIENLPTMELLGVAGDVWIMHPLTPHRGRPNPTGKPRIISNPVVSQTTPMQLGPSARTPVEIFTTRRMPDDTYEPPRAEQREVFQPSRIVRWESEGVYQSAARL